MTPMYRFRILNASNARRYRLSLDPPPGQGSSFIQIGSDQGLLAGIATKPATTSPAKSSTATEARSASATVKGRRTN